jgi:hypothetical protein
MREQFYTNIWAEGVLREAIKSPSKTCVTTDCRFLNEVNATRDAGKQSDGSLIIRLYRETGLEDNHYSETALDSHDIALNQRQILSEYTSILMRNHYEQVTASMWKWRGQGVPVFDYFIDNNYTLNDLRNNMITILQNHGIYTEPTLS